MLCRGKGLPGPEDTWLLGPTPHFSEFGCACHSAIENPFFCQCSGGWVGPVTVAMRCRWLPLTVVYSRLWSRYGQLITGLISQCFILYPQSFYIMRSLNIFFSSCWGQEDGEVKHWVDCREDLLWEWQPENSHAGLMTTISSPSAGILVMELVVTGGKQIPSC